MPTCLSTNGTSLSRGKATGDRGSLGLPDLDVLPTLEKLLLRSRRL